MLLAIVLLVFVAGAASVGGAPAAFRPSSSCEYTCRGIVQMVQHVNGYNFNTGI